MKLEVIKSLEGETVETYLVADISTSIFSDWEESSHIIAFNELYRIVTNLDAGDGEMNIAPRVDFYLPNPLKDRVLAKFAELNSNSQELSDQPLDGLNEGPYLKLNTVLSAVITEISRNHQPQADYQVRISDE